MIRVMCVVWAVSSVAAPPTPDVPTMDGKIYVGGAGVKVAVIRVGPASDHKALLQVTGSGTELDGLALPYDVETSSRGPQYVTQFHGGRYATLTSRSNGSATLSLPGQDADVALTFNEALTAALKPADLYQLQKKQLDDGTIAKVQAFDRTRKLAASERDLAAIAVATQKQCRSEIGAAVDWASITDPILRTYSIPSFCGAPLAVLQELCDSEEARKIVQAQIKKVACRFAAEGSIALDKDGTVRWTVSETSSNLDAKAKEFFEKNLSGSASGSSSATGGVVLPWGKAQSLGERRALDRTVVCTDHKSHLVVIAPSDDSLQQMFYGDGHQLVAVLPPASRGMGGSTFLDPRFFAKTANENFRGMDMRIHSHVEFDASAKTCAVQCGERKVPLEVMDPTEAKPMLLAASFAPSPQKFLPHALLRDDRGRYYYVDRGFRPGEEKSFRLFVGPKGSLTLQKMTNVVADSEGEIFSTKRGELRLVIDRSAASVWIERGKKSALRALPLNENLTMIYNDLGVYTAMRLGTPCDDL